MPFCTRTQAASQQESSTSLRCQTQRKNAFARATMALRRTKHLSCKTKRREVWGVGVSPRHFTIRDAQTTSFWRDPATLPSRFEGKRQLIKMRVRPEMVARAAADALISHGQHEPALSPDAVAVCLCAVAMARTP